MRLHQQNTGPADSALDQATCLGIWAGYNSTQSDFIVDGGGRLHLGVNDRLAQERFSFAETRVAGFKRRNFLNSQTATSLLYVVDEYAPAPFSLYANQQINLLRLRANGQYQSGVGNPDARMNGLLVDVSGGTYDRRIGATILGGNVGIGAALPDESAILELQSTTQGLMLPRMTTVQRDAITSPGTSLMIYNTSTNKLNFYNGSAWEQVTSA